jgi:hypothetical protein
MLPAFNSNLLPGEEVDQILVHLQPFVQGLRVELGWREVGVELRIGRKLIRQCQRDRRAVDRLRRGLDEVGAVVTSINAFPLLPFQDQSRKQQVYEPDWTRMERQELSQALIPIACALVATDPVCISTLPGSYKPWGARANDPKRIAAAWGRWAAAAWQHRTSHSRQAVLCPEPEPWCTLENSHELAAFWQGPMAHVGLSAAAAQLGDRGAAQEACRQHLGYCHDTCHVSVAAESQEEFIQRAQSAGLTPQKCQFAAAAEVQLPAGLAALRALDEPRFLHQSLLLEARDGYWRLADLNELDVGQRRLPTADRARSHFHLPITWMDERDGLRATVSEAEAGVRACLAAGCQTVAVETYTWSVLAQEARDPLCGTARELDRLATLLAAS